MTLISALRSGAAAAALLLSAWGEARGEPLFREPPPEVGLPVAWYWRFLVDLNGDGLDDLIIPGAAPDADVGAYHGNGEGFDRVLMWSYRHEDGVPEDRRDMRSRAGTGDVDGDGWTDLVVGGPDHAHPQSGDEWEDSECWGFDACDNGVVMVFRGDGDAFEPTPFWLRYGAGGARGFGTRISDGRDLDGDGFDDFLIESAAGGCDIHEYCDEFNNGWPLIFRGSASGLVGDPWSPTALPLDGFVDESYIRCDWCNDWNEDGIEDVCCRARERDLHVYYSPPSWGAPDESYDDVEIDLRQLGAKGDVDGDGRSDRPTVRYLEAEDDHQAGFFLGGPRSWLFNPPVWVDERLGVTAADLESGSGPGTLLIPDVNGDGASELAVSAPLPPAEGDNRPRRRILVLPGERDPTEMRAAWTLDCNCGLTPVGNFDGDGLADLLVTTSRYEDGWRIYLLYFSAGLGAGLPCEDAAQCASGICAESVCCAGCEGCTECGPEGACLPVAAGVEAEECTGPCDTGLCGGDGACEARPSGTPCGERRECDSQGSCLEAGADAGTLGPDAGVRDAGGGDGGTPRRRDASRGEDVRPADGVRPGTDIGVDAGDSGSVQPGEPAAPASDCACSAGRTAAGTPGARLAWWAAFVVARRCRRRRPAV